jgi:hypothetical protein
MAQNNSLLNMATANPVSTDVHNNINDLIMKAEMDSKLKQYSMSAYKQPQPITGTIPDVALSPLLTLKSLGSVGKKLLERTGLKNPISHYTRAQRAGNIVRQGLIKGSEGNFPNKVYKGDNLKTFEKKLMNRKGVSITRDPAFLQRPHSHVGTDVKFIMDRSDLTRRGFKLKPYAEASFRKTLPYNHTQYGKMNPRFEFEERVRGNIPLKDVRLIDLIRIPEDKIEAYQLIDDIPRALKANIPIIRYEGTTNPLLKIKEEMIKDDIAILPNLKRLLNTPSYKLNPFKTNKIKVWDENLQKIVTINNPSFY